MDFVEGVRKTLLLSKPFRNKIFVVKVSGKLVEDPLLLSNLLSDVVFLNFLGVRPVIVHGAGKQIDLEYAKLGLEKKLVDGLRYTDERGLEVIKSVLEKINQQMDEKIVELGGESAAFDGVNEFVVKAVKKTIGSTGAPTDYGFVGSVVGVDSKLVDLLNEGFIPVLACLGQDETGQVYNINADEVSIGVAKLVKAEKLFLLSDVPGVLANPADKTTLITELSTTQANELISKGVISCGMIPKVQACLNALEAVNSTHLLDGTTSSILDQVFNQESAKGTVFVK